MAPPPPPLPKHWPLKVAYLHCPRLSKSLSQAQLDSLLLLAEPGAGHVQRARRTRPGQISDATHPAFGQLGLFAGEALEPGAFILPYLGYVHAAGGDVDETSDYDISLDRDLGIGVDAARMGNEARFVNDYRGVASAGPNAEFRECWVPGERGGRVKTMGVFVLPAGKSKKRCKGIPKGAEILVSYGKGFWRERCSEPEPTHEATPEPDHHHYHLEQEQDDT